MYTIHMGDVWFLCEEWMRHMYIVHFVLSSAGNIYMSLDFHGLPERLHMSQKVLEYSSCSYVAIINSLNLNLRATMSKIVGFIWVYIDIDIFISYRIELSCKFKSRCTFGLRFKRSSHHWLRILASLDSALKIIQRLR